MTLDPVRLREWLAVDADDLAARCRVPFTLTETREELHRLFADEFFDDLASARRVRLRFTVTTRVGRLVRTVVLIVRWTPAGTRGS